MNKPRSSFDQCYRAIQAREARFDGRFFTAVLTTGIFCRPICPARTPRPENCRFLPTAAEALRQGFRPCRRCRPEVPAGLAAARGIGSTVSRGLKLIARGELDHSSVAALAECLGLGDRQLRRAFRAQLGVTPLAVAKMRRVLQAQALLEQSSLSLTDVATAAGFGSVRRFNVVIKEAFGSTPSALRGSPRPWPIPRPKAAVVALAGAVGAARSGARHLSPSAPTHRRSAC